MENTVPTYEFVFRDLPEHIYHDDADAFADGDGTEKNPYKIMLR